MKQPAHEVTEITQAAIAATCIVLLLAVFIVYFIITFRKRQMEHLREKKIMQQQFERDAMRAQLEITEATLKKVSDEIHDNIGQSLTLAKLQFRTATQENFQEHFDAGNQMVSRAISDLRNLSRSLSGNFILEHGLVRSIQRELEIVQDSGEITCTFQHKGEHPHLNAQEEIILFRCVQEGLNNAVKHSSGTSIGVNISHNNTGLEIEINDNGNGIPANAPEGLGMKNMRQRIALLKGKLELNSTANGTRLVLFIPQPNGQG